MLLCPFICLLLRLIHPFPGLFGLNRLMPLDGLVILLLHDLCLGILGLFYLIQAFRNRGFRAAGGKANCHHNKKYAEDLKNVHIFVFLLVKSYLGNNHDDWTL